MLNIFTSRNKHEIEKIMNNSTLIVVNNANNMYNNQCIY